MLQSVRRLAYNPRGRLSHGPSSATAKLFYGAQIPVTHLAKFFSFEHKSHVRDTIWLQARDKKLKKLGDLAGRTRVLAWKQVNKLEYNACGDMFFIVNNDELKESGITILFNMKLCCEQLFLDIYSQRVGSGPEESTQK